MAQPDQDQQKKIVADAAAQLAAGKPLTDDQRREAVVWGARLALETGETAVLDVFILALGGHHKEALRRLLDLAFDGTASSSPSSSDPLEDMLPGSKPADSSTTSRGFRRNK